jgi:4-diphosphocytidyl-2-C-methyl-D-erythritol kinase
MRVRPRAVEARVLAQAKINLFLRVLGREVDGYHSIETLFLRLELADVVRIRVGDGDERGIHCHGSTYPADGLGPPEGNLTYRAAVAYAEATGWPRSFAIDVEKNIPVGGGLGGGSADAAAVLRALDAMAPYSAGTDAITRIAGRLGADVPFLASDSVCALAWGRGERMLDLRPPPQRQVELLVPAFAVSTRWAYEQLAATWGDFKAQPALRRLGELSSWERLETLAVNDLEPVVSARHPEIPACVIALRGRGARIAMMSGSGSTAFGIFDRWSDAVSDVAGAVTSLRTRTANRVVGVELTE